MRTGNTTVTTPHSFLPHRYKETGVERAEDLGLETMFRLAVPVLVRVLQDKRESDDTRREAAFALGAIGDKNAVRFLEAKMKSNDPYLIEISREALSKLLIPE
jgi:HEAT repeat protein